MSRNFAKREPKEFGAWRGFWQLLVCKLVYGTWYRIFNDYKITGRENIDRNKFYIVAANHVSAIDPFLVVDTLYPTHIAYMAKAELFVQPFSRFFLNHLGAFAVNRDKLGVSTIKTALGIKKTRWVLGLFPQGTRKTQGDMDDVTRGFAGLAKTMKCDILPLAIKGSAKESRYKYKNKIRIKIGKPIPFNDDTRQMVKDWSSAIEDLTRMIDEEEQRKK